MSQYSLTERTVPVPVSVPGKRFRRFRFHVRFLGKRFRRFRFSVPVRFLGHPVMVDHPDLLSFFVFEKQKGKSGAKIGELFITPSQRTSTTGYPSKQCLWAKCPCQRCSAPNVMIYSSC